MFEWNSNFKISFSLCISLLSVFTIFLICIWCFFCNTAFVFKRLRICYGFCIVIGGRSIIRFISVIIPETTCCFSVILLYSSKLYIGITTSKSFALSIKTLLIFDVQWVNEALFLNAKNLFLTSINSLLSSRRSDLSIDVLNLISMLRLYLSSALLDWSWTSIHFLVINLTSL